MSTLHPARRSNEAANRPLIDPPMTSARLLPGLPKLVRLRFHYAFVVLYHLPGFIGAIPEKAYDPDHAGQAAGADPENHLATHDPRRIRARAEEPQWLRRPTLDFGKQPRPRLGHQAQTRRTVRFSPSCARLFLDRRDARSCARPRQR